MSDKVKYLLIISLLISLIIIPKIAFYENGIHDSFSYSNTALAQTALNDEGIELSPYENAGNSINRHANGWSVRWVVTSSIASISLVTGLSPRELQSLPICAIGIIIMAYLVASKLTNDWRLAGFYTVMIAFDPTVNSLTNGTYIQGWGFIFYFMLIYLLLIIVERKHYLALMKKDEHYKPFLLYGSLAACSFVMMFYTYYSALVYGAIMVAVVAGGILFASTGKSLSKKRVAIFILLLAIAFVSLYFVEDTVRFAVSNFSGWFGTFIGYASDVIVAGGMRFYIGLLSYILIFIPIGLLAYRWLCILFKTRKLPAMTSEDLFISAILATGLVNLVMYAGLGLVDFKYFIMFFSLSALYAVGRLHWSDFSTSQISLRNIPVKQIFALALAMLFILKFAAYIAPIVTEDNINKNDSMKWLSENCLYSGTDCISDLGVSGEIMLLQVEKGNSEFNSLIYSDYYLTSLVSGNESEFLRANGDITFLIMTESNMDGHFNIGNWETWESDVSPVDIISYHPNLQRIYSSSELTVWRIY